MVADVTYRRSGICPFEIRTWADDFEVMAEQAAVRLGCTMRVQEFSIELESQQNAPAATRALKGAGRFPTVKWTLGPDPREE
jgi:hypothetical protein